MSIFANIDNSPRLSCLAEMSSQSSCKRLVEFFQEISEKLARRGTWGGWSQVSGTI